MNPLSKKARVGVVVSIVWLIVLFMIALNESRGCYDEEFLAIFLIGGILPIIGWGIRWVIQADS